MQDVAVERAESDALDLFESGQLRTPTRPTRRPATQVEKRTVAATPPPIARGRPPRREPRKVRYSDPEWATIVERARECGKAPARYVREVSLGAVPKARRSHANAELVRELGRVGIALRHLAAAARDAGQAPDAAALEGTLAEILAVVRRFD